MKDLILDDLDKLNIEYRCGGGFRNCFRMTSSDFEFLLTLTAPRIIRNDTSFRRAIPACERLAVKLRFLATGDKCHYLMHLFKISKQAMLVLFLLEDVGKYPEKVRSQDDERRVDMYAGVLVMEMAVERDVRRIVKFPHFSVK
ncbi:hypothetical protein PR048_027715 [Dryococelus australis]|uniref:Uncharacterized protein n=1 Tax=Dryococelus australis TaxID=614101 RepID=A0ABQ9GHA3_9NEOP|nr:hypothetical protein PR048_027715 [Dryococelus australis]